MKRNIGLTLFIIVLALGAIVLGYYLGNRASVKDVLIESTVATEVVTTDSLEVTPELPATGQKQYITVDGKECEIAQKTENPYRKGEFVIVTKNNCPDQYSWEPRFFVESSTGRKELRLGDDFMLNNALQEGKNGKMFVYLAADEIMYRSAFGEGAACQSGGGVRYVKFNIKTNTPKEVSSLGTRTQCHNPIPGTEETYIPAQCIDSTNSYTYGNTNLKIVKTCQATFKTGENTLSVTLNDKKILDTKITDVQAEKFIFPGFENTAGLLAGKKTVTFSFDDLQYIVNIATGVISTQ